MSERYIISGGGLPAILLPATATRLTAAQAFEAEVKRVFLPAKDLSLRGNTAFRSFIEGGRSAFNWGDFRLDIVTENS